MAVNNNAADWFKLLLADYNSMSLIHNHGINRHQRRALKLHCHYYCLAPASVLMPGISYSPAQMAIRVFLHWTKTRGRTVADRSFPNAPRMIGGQPCRGRSCLEHKGDLSWGKKHIAQQIRTAAAEAATVFDRKIKSWKAVVVLVTARVVS